MKKILITTLLSSIAFSGIALAESNNDIQVPYSPSLSTVSVVSEEKEDVKTVHLLKVKERANRLINDRIKSLESNKQAILNNEKLSTEQKNTLSAVLTTNVTGLMTLKGSIASSADATSTKVLIDSIFKDYRIYGIVIPKVRLDARIYQLKNHSIKLSDTFTKLQNKINEQKAKGNDTSAWQKGLDDAKMLVAQDMFKLDQMLAETAKLTPVIYGTTSKAVIVSVNKDIKTISTDFNSIVSKVRKPHKLPKLPVAGTSTPVTATTTSR